jgi:CheY-like chemotaxis protein
MGMEAYKIAAALRGIVAQRLMRRLCLTCREPVDGKVPDRLRRFIPEGTPLNRGVGCPECAMTGYRGRFSIVEVLAMNQELERRIGSGATADRIAEAARANGMRSLFESGLRHVLAGETSMEELLRVVEVPHQESPAASPESSTPAAPPSAATAPAPAAASAAAPAPAPPGPAPRDTSAAAGPARITPAAPPPHVDLSNAFELLEDTLEPIPLSGRTRHRAGVLLVDDEDGLRGVMKDLLEREGYRVAEARDGVQALDEVDRFAPDIIVLDLNLPGMDGYTVLSQLRSRPATEKVPVIVLTAKGDEDNEVRVFELGADDFLTKPFRARALSARLEAVLARRK